MNWQRTASVFLGLLIGLTTSTAQAKSKGGSAGNAGDTGRFVIDYVNAFANSNANAWASVDLGCLTMQRRLQTGTSLASDTARQCWTETQKSHSDMVAQKAEQGVFDAVGRDSGFGLLHDRHRPSENWKDYPPALFVSPAVVRRDQGPAPEVTVVKVGPVQSFALVGLSGDSPVSVKGQAVDLKVVYRDPLTAPLALRPEEVWWVTGAQRRFGPVREVQVRLIVLSGLRKFGLAADQAVMNEAVAGAPLIATTRYGLRPGLGRQFEDPRADAVVKGELLPGTAQWWERKDADNAFREALAKAAGRPSAERSGLLTRLLLIDPTDRDVNTMRGEDAYRDFLKQGVAKGGLAARDEDSLWELAELYWTLQAQTWRQELTAVSEGYEPAADALYRASAAYDTLVQQGTATPEQQRRLGALTRWNNDPSAALRIHERVLAATPKEGQEHGRLLTEIAWDRLQWISWERRFDHPWLSQAEAEARQGASEAKRPERALAANYALVVVESLRVPRNPRAFAAALDVAKQDLGRVPGNKGLHDHLIANDLVRALTPEADNITLPNPARSAEVADVAIHANPPKQDIIWQFNFDKDKLNGMPAGFTRMTQGSTEPADWQVQSDGDSLPGGQFVVQARPCQPADCAQLLVADHVRTTYPDVTVLVQDLSENGQGEAGVALAVTDNRNYYAVTLQPSSGTVTTRRIKDGVATVIGQSPVKLAARPWHTIRVQRINFIHLDKGRLGVFIDGAQVAAVEDAVLPPEGRIGLITIGRTAARFDGLHVIDLVSNRPLSGPAAY